MKRHELLTTAVSGCVTFVFCFVQFYVLNFLWHMLFFNQRQERKYERMIIHQQRCHWGFGFIKIKSDQQENTPSSDPEQASEGLGNIGLKWKFCTWEHKHICVVFKSTIWAIAVRICPVCDHSQKRIKDCQIFEHGRFSHQHPTSSCMERKGSLQNSKGQKW